ncbi:MAG: ABC transporter ATP-binding protein [Fimbriimonas ginsengisoli]|uniref:ABC transporter ATP-binding protein n=1 Tax=Fimbriimonas ginsengisoli TaxID=1005039 RepID=A0A931M179_FIMGI|nr:ABC transporter ATP-binding protein [Fimbriimonas ginsengisoli]
MLRVEGLGVRFGRAWVLRGVSFSLEKGQSLAVTGRNGAGKSTLLKLIAGLLTPSEGRVAMPEGDPRRTMALSALDGALYPWLTPREHLRLAADLRGCEHREAELLDRVNLTVAAHKAASELSTGMRARLKLAMAIQADPWLLLLDEPGAGLDEEGRALLDVIAREQVERGALVVATNDPAERRLGTHELALEGKA